MTEVFVIENNEISSVEIPSSHQNPITRSLQEPKPLVCVQECNKQKHKSIVLHPELCSAEKKKNNGFISIEREENVPKTEIQNNITRIEMVNSRNDGTQIIMNTSLKLEKDHHTEKEDRRKESFKHIILRGMDKFPWIQCILYTWGVMLFGIICTFPYTLVPAHDLVTNPEYWYEILFHGSYMMTLYFLEKSLEAGYFLNLDSLKLPQSLILICGAGIISRLCFLILTYYLWTEFFGYQYPIPLLGISTNGPWKLFHTLLIWLSFPKEWRNNRSLKRRVRFHILNDCSIMMMLLIYEFLMQTIDDSQALYQPFVCFTIPLARELFLYILEKMMKRTSNGDLAGAVIFLKYAFSTVFTLKLCNMIGAHGSDATSWVLMGSDYFLNILITFRIVWMKNRHPEKIENQIDLLQDLVVNELVEFHAPMSFMLVLAVAYFGPNGNLFGNVLSDYWTFTAIKDIYQTLLNMGMFFLIDFSSAVTSAIILWIFCKVKLWEAIYQVQKEFWLPFSIVLGYSLSVVSIKLFLILDHNSILG